MGTIISNDFISVADAEITSRSSASGYDKKNVMNLWNLKRRFRAGDLTKSDSNPLLIFDMGSAQTVDAVFLNDVNFDTVRIFGHASDLGTNWAAASLDTGDVTIGKGGRVSNRYKAYIPLTSFNYRWLAVGTPAAASAVGDYTTAWEVGTVAIMDTVTEFSTSMGYPMVTTAEELYVDVGRSERISLNDAKQGLISLSFSNARPIANTDLDTFQNMGDAEPLLIYVNDSDTAQAWIVRKDTTVSTTQNDGTNITGSTMQLKELV